MAAEEVIAAKQQLHAAHLAQRANSYESSATKPSHAGARLRNFCASWCPPDAVATFPPRVQTYNNSVEPQITSANSSKFS